MVSRSSAATRSGHPVTARTPSALCRRPKSNAGSTTRWGTGGTVANCVGAATQLAADGIQAEVLNAACIKPLDEEMLVDSARRTGHVVTVEDHSVHGGLGGAVSELLAEAHPTLVRRLGVQGFGESGDHKGLYARHGLDAAGITRATRKFLGR